MSLFNLNNTCGARNFSIVVALSSSLESRSLNKRQSMEMEVARK